MRSRLQDVMRVAAFLPAVRTMQLCYSVSDGRATTPQPPDVGRHLHVYIRHRPGVVCGANPERAPRRSDQPESQETERRRQRHNACGRSGAEIRRRAWQEAPRTAPPAPCRNGKTRGAPSRCGRKATHKHGHGHVTPHAQTPCAALTFQMYFGFALGVCARVRPCSVAVPRDAACAPG